MSSRIGFTKIMFPLRLRALALFFCFCLDSLLNKRIAKITKKLAVFSLRSLRSSCEKKHPF